MRFLRGLLRAVVVAFTLTFLAGLALMALQAVAPATGPTLEGYLLIMAVVGVLTWITSGRALAIHGPYRLFLSLVVSVVPAWGVWVYGIIYALRRDRLEQAAKIQPQASAVEMVGGTI
jgi:hypothetical protein